jgi:hypothetical protein
MNDARRDPFESMMSRRIEQVELPDLPLMEIREAPIKDVKPILDKLADMDPSEVTYRLLGLSLYVDGEQLTYERVINMTAEMVKRLLPVMPAVFNVYGITMKSDAPTEASGPLEEKKEDLGSSPEPEPSSNSPSSSTKRSAKSNEK